jgi:hypothetical protein
VKLNLKAALAGVVTAGIAGGGLFALAAPVASAAPTAPPWEADANAAPPYGNIVFYDANGNEVTSGTSLTAPFAFAAGTTAADTNATKATIGFYNPQPNGTPPVPGTWTGTSESGTTTFSPATSLPTGTPASVVALAPTFPVDTTATANITTWLAANVPSTTAGFANTIQVRLTDSGAAGAGNATGTYWETDIGYNTTSAPITVDGTTVPANGWAELFPFVNVSTTGLATTAVGGHLTQTGTTSITLTATVTPATAAGGVNFYDNGTFLANVTTPGAGTYTFTYVPAVGSHSYTATFNAGDAPGDPSGANTTSAAIIGGSTSSAAAVSVTPPQTGTTVTLATTTPSIAFGASASLTSTASAADSTTPAGTVQFLNGTTPITGCTAVAINTGGTASTAACTTTTLPQGTNSITAVFTPTSNTYATSTSTAVTITVAAPTVCPPGNPNSVCTDTQNVQVVVNPGSITITTPYTATNPFVLPPMTLSTDGTFLQSSATFPGGNGNTAGSIVVTSTLAPAYPWTVSVAATPLTSGGNSIPSTGLGLGTGTVAAGFSGTVTFTAINPLNPNPADAVGTQAGPGLSAAPQTWAHSTPNDGSAQLGGATLTLLAPTSTPAGTYNGTITFSIS